MRQWLASSLLGGGLRSGLSMHEDGSPGVHPGRIADETTSVLRAMRGLRRGCLSALALFAASVALAGGDARAASAPTTALVLEVRDAIGPASADYIVRGLGRARERGAALVVIQLDTPGGLDTSMRTIAQAILASAVPVAVYVAPEGARAASAGTYILYAAHLAAMAPATTLGAATPVAIGLPMPVPERKPAREPAGDETAPDGTGDGPAKEGSDVGGTERAPPPLAPADATTAKQVHDAAAFIRGLAQQHGRNAVWAERAVREAVSLTAVEAQREKVIDLVAVDVADLLRQADGRTVRMHDGLRTLATRDAQVERLQPDWRQRLLSVIANPSFALVLLMLGIYGLIFEFSSPGFGVPGTVGAICLLLAMFALQMLPVNYAGLGLIVLGVALMAAELVTPTFGVLGVGGIVAFVGGALLLFDRDMPGFGVPLPLIFGLALTSAAAVALAGGMALRARRRPLVSGREALLGAEGVVIATDGAGEGEGGGRWALVHGERWQVASSEPLAPGQHVRVTASEGLVLHVRRVQTEGGSDTAAQTSKGRAP